MPSIARGVLRQMAGGGGERPKERWEPSEVMDSAIRLYRYESPVEVNGEQTVEKRLCYVRMLHFHGPGVAPTDCPGGAACSDCRKAAMLQAAGTEDALEKAKALEASACPTFVVVPLDEPTRFRCFDARFSAFQGICLAMAQAGGWRLGSYPKKEEFEKETENAMFFDKCVDQGADKVCGPTGCDLILTPVKKGKGFQWGVRREIDGCAVLPFPEDSKVLNPEVVQARIRAAVAKKNKKEGD